MTSVRTARASDDAALLDVDRATWGPTSSPVPVPDWRDRTFFVPDRGPEGFLVAEVDDVVVGYVGLHRTGPASSAHVRRVDGLGVLPSAQGRGVGRALVESALARATAEGARRVTLAVLAHNHGARRLYERCGFEVEGVLRGEYVLDGVEVDDVLMARSVTP